MSTLTYSCDNTTISEIIGQPVSIWSEESQHECEALVDLAMSLAMSKAKREAFFNGPTDDNGGCKRRGIVAIPGLQAAEALRGYMEWLQEARTSKKAHSPCARCSCAPHLVEGLALNRRRLGNFM